MGLWSSVSASVRPHLEFVSPIRPLRGEETVDVAALLGG